MTEPRWPSRAIVLAIHDEAVAEFGGLAGVRDEALFESALDRPKNLVAYSDSATLFELAASLCHGIVKNHPFLDGNKRTGLLSARAFLFLNAQIFEPGEKDEVETLVGVASGTVSEMQLARWFAEFSQTKRRR
jgi:death on curing protein